MNEPIEAIGSVTSARRTAAVAALGAGLDAEDASLAFLCQAQNIAAMAAGLFSVATSVVRTGQLVRDAVREDAAGERRVALAAVRLEFEAYAEDLRERLEELQRRIGRLEAALRQEEAEEEYGNG